TPCPPAARPCSTTGRYAARSARARETPRASSTRPISSCSATSPEWRATCSATRAPGRGWTARGRRAATPSAARPGRPGAPRPGPGVASIPDAVRSLDPRGLEVLVARIPAVDFFQRSPGWRTPAERFRLHAVAVQTAAARLAEEVGHENADELAVAALLHDV